VEQAINFYKFVGKDVALAEFSNSAGMFVQGDLYVFVLSPTGIMLAHGVNDKFVGLDFLGVKDSDGKAFNKQIVDDAKSKGSGWVQYKWYHPRRNKTLPKLAYFQKENDLIFCSAVYNYED
jgi:signal transduction histidine kinase